MTTGRSLARVCLFCGSNVGARPAYADAARTLGRTLASAGDARLRRRQRRTMHEAAEGAGAARAGVITEPLMARGRVAGLTALHVVRTMHERKAMMASLADAFVALPGGYGTFDELCEMLTWDQLGIHDKPAVLVNIDGYFDGFLTQLARAEEDRLLRPEHRALLSVVTTIADVLPAARAWTPPAISKWYRDRPPAP